MDSPTAECPESIEQKIEGFSRHVRPRLPHARAAGRAGRKLAKEMDEHRTISVSRVYVPNEYSVYLSEADREQFTGYEGSLIGELQDYLIEHARRESYAMLTPPTVLMKTDADLSIGEFGIATRMVQPEGKRGPQLDEPDAQVEPGATMIYKAKPPQPTEAVSPAELGLEEETFSLTMNRRTHALEGAKVVLGRSKRASGGDAPSLAGTPRCAAEGGSLWLVEKTRRTARTEGKEGQRSRSGKATDHARRNDSLRKGTVVRNCGRRGDRPKMAYVCSTS